MFVSLKFHIIVSSYLLLYAPFLIFGIIVWTFSLLSFLTKKKYSFETASLINLFLCNQNKIYLSVAMVECCNANANLLTGEKAEL